jgi:hypothetical protein
VLEVGSSNLLIPTKKNEALFVINGQGFFVIQRTDTSFDSNPGDKVSGNNGP